MAFAAQAKGVDGLLPNGDDVTNLSQETPSPTGKSKTSPWVSGVAAGIGAAVGSAAVNGLGPDMSIRIISGGTVGAVLGYLVFRFARTKGQEKLGHAALVVCILSGALLGLILAVPVALIFFLVARGRAAGNDRRTA